jgi:hypothetical protein
MQALFGLSNIMANKLPQHLHAAVFLQIAKRS